MCGNVKLDYNKYGAPILDNNKKIAISHSKQLVAIIVSKFKSGIDTEIISKRILKIKDKFISKYDNINESQEDLTIAWSTKECIFKWHEKGNINFKDDILIKDGGTIGVASDADAITIASNGQLTLTQTLIGTALDISGDIDVDGTTNLDIVDIDGAVDMASTLQVDGMRDHLLSFHKKWYSSNIMHLVILSNSSIADLEKWATEKFSEIKNFDVEVPALGEPHPFPAGKLGKLIKFVPI